MPYVIRKLPRKNLFKVYTVEIDENNRKTYKPHSKEGLRREMAEKQLIALNISKKEKKEKKEKENCNCNYSCCQDDSTQNGGGVIQFLPVIKYGTRFLTRNSPTTSFKKFLQQKGEMTIKNIYVGRIPIEKNLRRLIDVLSLGRSYLLRKELNYDDFFHNFLLFEMENVEAYIIEKNQVVAYSIPTQKQKDNLLYQFPANQNNTLNKIFENAQKGTKNFWLYNASDNNCQIFVANLLQKNGYSISGKNEIYPQQSQKIINTLPYPLRSIPEVITNIAAIGTRILD
jgi:hypothetical protein